MKSSMKRTSHGGIIKIARFLPIAIGMTIEKQL